MENAAAEAAGCNSEETLDPAVVGVDNRCASGQCIYGDGQAYREAETYEEVRLMHADFHKLTAEAVSLPMAGKADEAKELLNGNYARLSERLKRRILGLSQQISA